MASAGCARERGRREHTRGPRGKVAGGTGAQRPSGRGEAPEVWFLRVLVWGQVTREPRRPRVLLPPIIAHTRALGTGLIVQDGRPRGERGSPGGSSLAPQSTWQFLRPPLPGPRGWKMTLMCE